MAKLHKDSFGNYYEVLVFNRAATVAPWLHFMHIVKVRSRRFEQLTKRLKIRNLFQTNITPGIQKHVTVLNTRNGDILRSGNIKGGMFWCLHINTFEDVSTRDVHIYLEHNFWDNSMKFHILMWYIKLIIQFYYFGLLFLVMLSVLTN